MKRGILLVILSVFCLNLSLAYGFSENSYFWNILNVFIILFCVIVGIILFKVKLSSEVGSNKNKKSNKLKYRNDPDSESYNEIHGKLTTYVLTNIKKHKYPTIKKALVDQGFEGEEVDEIYLELLNDRKII